MAARAGVGRTCAAARSGDVRGRHPTGAEEEEVLLARRSRGGPERPWGATRPRIILSKSWPGAATCSGSGDRARGGHGPSWSRDEDEAIAPGAGDARRSRTIATCRYVDDYHPFLLLRRRG
ncbi:hypothetical protein VPH35_024123 [Triticum aestivum]